MTCVDFLQWALPQMGMRWAGFRRVRRQVCRRIQARIKELGIGDFAGYRRYLEQHADEWRQLDRRCRVTISRFWRDRGVFEALRDVVIPTLAAEKSTLSCWSAGCASGEEPYSIAIMARHIAVDVDIVASDADAHMLQRARAAAYQAATLRELPAAWRAQAFDDGVLGADYRNVRFVCADIRDEPPLKRADLILCRNLAFTYFDHATQRAILARMISLFDGDGALVIGAHETLPDNPWLVPWSPKSRGAKSRGSRAIYRLACASHDASDKSSRSRA